MKKLLALLALIPIMVFGQTPTLQQVTNAGNTSTKIIKYNANHGIQFDARTLTDKGYVDSVKTTIPTTHSLAQVLADGNDANGIFIKNFFGARVTQGGNAISYVRSAGDSAFVYYTSDYSHAGVQLRNSTESPYVHSFIGASVNAMAMEFNGLTHNNSFYLDSLKGTFGSIINYGANYGARYTVRTLVDKRYCDSAIAAISSTLPGWSITGNASTVDGTNFIGTTDNIPFNFKINNQKAGRISAGSELNTSLGYLTISSGSLTGVDNDAFGYQSLRVNTTGSFNNSYGVFSLQANTTGMRNTAIGHNALFTNITGSCNTAIGMQALRQSTGRRNTAIGDSAGYAATGDDNLFLGYKAGWGWTGSHRGFIGNPDMDSIMSFNFSTGQVNITAGHLKVVDGSQASGYIMTSDANGLGTWTAAASATTTAWGLLGNTGTTGGTNYIGTNDNQPLRIKINSVLAGFIQDSAQGGNTSLGGNALTVLNSNQMGCTAIGVNAMRYYNATSQVSNIPYNTAVGYDALRGSGTAANNTGYMNTAVGYDAMKKNTTGYQNAAFGVNSLASNTTGFANEAFGMNSLVFNTTGNYNSAHGEDCLYANTTGSDNTAMGQYALQANTIGNQNTAIGSGSLFTTVDNNNETAIGYNALHLATGAANTAVGASSQAVTSTGINNNSFGYASLPALTTGSRNISIGVSSANGTTTGNRNVVLGTVAFLSNVSGNSNIVIGDSAAYDVTGSRNIIIGAKAGQGWTGSDAVIFGNPTTKIAMFGDMTTGNWGVGNTTVTPTYKFEVTGTLKASTSATTPKVILSGSTSGSVVVTCAATAATNTFTFPAGTTDLSATGGTSQVLKQISSGGAITVAQLATSDLSDVGIWVDYTASSTQVGYATNAITVLYKKMDAHTVIVQWVAGGTSTNTATSFTIPFTTANNGFTTETLGRASNSGGASVAGLVYISANSSIVNLSSAADPTAWTASGAKTVAGQIILNVQ